jgi:hypothetical protein
MITRRQRVNENITRKVKDSETDRKGRSFILHFWQNGRQIQAMAHLQVRAGQCLQLGGVRGRRTSAAAGQPTVGCEKSVDSAQSDQPGDDQDRNGGKSCENI